MMARQISDSIYWLGVSDWDRTIFDDIFPLTHGTSYNSYLIKGSDKNAIVDTVEPAKSELLLSTVQELGLESLDYIISNHAEQDHSGTIPQLLEKYPSCKVVTNAKCKEYLKQLLDLRDEQFHTITDRQLLNLGNVTLEFIFTPWVHWPETMVTYYHEAKTLFSCDLFGSHLATCSLFAENDDRTLNEAKVYYAQIMMPFARHVANHLTTLSSLEISYIAPSHGPVYSKPETILSLYRDWSSAPPEKKALLLYATMHGSTEQLILRLTDELNQRNVPFRLFNTARANISEIITASLDCSVLCFASPVILSTIHPTIASTAFILNALRPKAHTLAVISSYNWSSRVADQLQQMLSTLKLSLLPPVQVKGPGGEKSKEEIKRLAEEIVEAMELSIRL